jgi:hypothetical protein
LKLDVFFDGCLHDELVTLEQYLRVTIPVAAALFDGEREKGSVIPPNNAQLALPIR